MLVAARKRIRIRFWRMFEFLLFLIYPSVTASVLRYFMCREVEGVRYLQADMTQVCYTNFYNQWALVAGFFALIYPFGIPAFFFYRLYIHRHRLNAPSVRAENGFLYDGMCSSIFFSMSGRC